MMTTIRARLRLCGLLATVLAATLSGGNLPASAESKQPAKSATNSTLAKVRRASDLYVAGDYKAAAEIWRTLAAEGNVGAQFNLAQAYRLGQGVPKDLASAQKLYELAARGGDSLAMASLAAMLYFDAPPRRDRPRAIALLNEAAQLNEPQAQYMLGVIKFNGDEMPRDHAEGFALIQLAVASGHKDARDAEAQMRQIMSAEELAASESRLAELKESINKPHPARRMLAAPTAAELAAATKVAPPPQAKAEPRTEPKVQPPQPPVKSAAVTSAQPSAGKAAPASAAASVPAPTTPASGDSYWLQLSSTKDEAGATKAAAKAAKDWADILVAGQGSRVVSADVPGKGTFWRVRVGPFADRAAADAGCKAIKAKGGDCLPVHN